MVAAKKSLGTGNRSAVDGKSSHPRLRLSATYPDGLGRSAIPDCAGNGLVDLD